MFPLYLFWNYLSPFPWCLGPCLMAAGFLCLWLSRFTSRLYPVWGKWYFLFSSLVRPLGVLLISWAWVEILSVQAGVALPGDWAGPLMNLIGWGLFLVALFDSFLRPAAIATVFSSPALAFSLHIYLFTIWLFFFFYELWALLVLGIRRSFLFARPEDPLVTSGPYKYQRHPQLFAAIFLVLCPWLSFARGYDNDSILAFQAANFLFFVLGMYLITINEEKDLLARLGDRYKSYKEKVPAFVWFRA